MEKTKEKSKKLDLNIDPTEMVKAGLHFGHKTSKVHPKMKPFLYGARNGVHIFDVEKTSLNLKTALEFIQTVIAEGKTILFVGTKIQMKKMVEETAKACGLPYVADRWLGGTFTNFETIKKRIDYFKELENKKISGELAKYTKKERLMFDREIESLNRFFSGLKSLAKLPDALFVVDSKKEHIAVTEARSAGVPVIALASTDCDLSQVTYPIAANDASRQSIEFFVAKVIESYKAGALVK